MNLCVRPRKSPIIPNESSDAGNRNDNFQGFVSSRNPAADFPSAMDHPFGPIEIRGAGDVGRNHAISHAETPNTIDLNGKKNGNPALVGLRASSMVAEPLQL